MRFDLSEGVCLATELQNAVQTVSVHTIRATQLSAGDGLVFVSSLKMRAWQHCRLLVLLGGRYFSKLTQWLVFI